MKVRGDQECWLLKQTILVIETVGVLRGCLGVECMWTSGMM